jgi:hypothetical protein
MLLNLNKQSWMDSMTLEKYSAHCAENEKSVGQMLKLAKLYKKVNFYKKKRKAFTIHQSLKNLSRSKKKKR